MSFPGHEKPSLDDLAHFGIKGMRWGVRTAQPQSFNRRYSQARREADNNSFGKRGVNRINKRLNDGKTYNQAVNRELGRAFAKSVLVGVGVTAALTVLSGGGGARLASKISERAATNRGRAAALSIVTSLKPKQRRGVYKITTL